MKLCRLGYWPREFRHHPPYMILEKTVDYDVAKIVNYLNSGFQLFSWQGYDSCVFACGIHDHKMGAWDMSDGCWVWPQGFAHYVAFHQIDLPVSFLGYVESKSFNLFISDEKKSILGLLKKQFEESFRPKIDIDSNDWDEFLERKSKCDDLKRLEQLKRKVGRYHNKDKLPHSDFVNSSKLPSVPISTGSEDVLTNKPSKKSPSVSDDECWWE